MLFYPGHIYQNVFRVLVVSTFLFLWDVLYNHPFGLHSIDVHPAGWDVLLTTTYQRTSI